VGGLAEPESAKPLGIPKKKIVDRLEQEIAWSGDQKKVRCSGNTSIAVSLAGGVVVVPGSVLHPARARMFSPKVNPGNGNFALRSGPPQCIKNAFSKTSSADFLR
jgi:hypothetical protein